MAGRASSSGNALTKAMRVLEEAAAAAEPRRLGEIAAASEVLKPTTHRILSTLVELGYVTSAGDGTYMIGPRLRALGTKASRVNAGDITAELESLRTATGHTVHLAVRSGNCAVYTHKVEPDQPYRIASGVGMRVPLHSSAIGKSILAYLPALEAKEIILSAGLPRRTDNTITTYARLVRELGQVRVRRYAIDDEENERTVRCIGSPVLDANGLALGGVSVSTVVFLVSRPQLEAFAPAVIASAKRLGLLLR